MDCLKHLRLALLLVQMWVVRQPMRMPAPNLPCDTFLGTNERIVQVGRIHNRMDSWEDGHLHLIQNGEHEVLMEDARTRAGIVDTMTARFADAA